MSDESMAGGASNASPLGGDAGASLDEVLVALQKSLSRVSAASRDVPADDARAMITGTVEFEIAAKFDISRGPKAGPTDRPDFLIHRHDGALNLKINGRVETDTRIKNVSEERQ